MYLVGAEHPNKAMARILLERCIHEGSRLVTDAEVLQEILHRYVAIARREAIQPAFDALLGVVDDVFAVERSEVERAKTLLHGRPGLSARDAIHLAAMERHGVTRILSFDAGFDGQAGIQRIAS
ncbi:MAG: type II toxin-antitoxin system VapC family toxin [Gemmatimonadetes bacterium]|nr:type II toxin-antitoxin system VapC family toxin [Gemmatimonadota bacterium]